MPLSREDLEAFARRIRPFFEPGLQGVAEEMALQLAVLGAGANIKSLRPETPLDEILGWVGTDSLNRIELLMTIETELGLEVADQEAQHSDSLTFRQLVVRIASSRNVV